MVAVLDENKEAATKAQGEASQPTKQPDTHPANTRPHVGEDTSASDFRLFSTRDGLVYGGEITGRTEGHDSAVAPNSAQVAEASRTKGLQQERLSKLSISHGVDFGSNARTIDPRTELGNVPAEYREQLTALALSEDSTACGDAIYRLKHLARNLGGLPVEAQRIIEYALRESDFEHVARGSIELLKLCGQSASATRPTLLWRMEDAGSSFDVAKEAASALTIIYPDVAWRDFEGIINNASKHNPDTIEAALHGLDELSKSERAVKLGREVIRLASLSLEAETSRRIDIPLAIKTACQLGGPAVCPELMKIAKALSTPSAPLTTGAKAELSPRRSEAVETALTHIRTHGESGLLPDLREMKAAALTNTPLRELLSSVIESISSRSSWPMRLGHALVNGLSG